MNCLQVCIFTMLWIVLLAAVLKNKARAKERWAQILMPLLSTTGYSIVLKKIFSLWACAYNDHATTKTYDNYLFSGEDYLARWHVNGTPAFDQKEASHAVCYTDSAQLPHLSFFALCWLCFLFFC